MNILQEDNKIVDLITFIGEAFPKNNFLTDSGSVTSTQTDHLQMIPSHSCTPCTKEVEGDTSSLDGGVDLDESANLAGCFMECGEPLIRALIKPHEGTYSHQPFDIHPRQMV